MWGILIALLSGALMSVQGVFNTELTKQSSLWVSTGWVQFSALLVCIAAWFFTGRQSIGTLARVEHKYILLGGVIGASYYSDSEHVCSWTCQSGYAYCGSSACCGVSHRAYGIVWSRQGGISVEKANRHGNGYWWNYFIQMGKIDKNSREKAAVF